MTPVNHYDDLIILNEEFSGKSFVKSVMGSGNKYKNITGTEVDTDIVRWFIEDLKVCFGLC